MLEKLSGAAWASFFVSRSHRAGWDGSAGVS